MAYEKREFLRRLDAGLKEKKLSDRAASLQAGGNESLVRDWRRKAKAVPTIDKIWAMAEVVGRSPEYLAWGVTRRGARPETATRVKITGEVAAGLWLDLDGFEDRDYPQHPLPIDERYPLEAQYGLVVVGTSINRVAHTGDILHCVDRAIGGAEPESGDLVIVERRRGGQKEITAKRYRPRGAVIDLEPDSLDPRWRDPIVYNPRIVGGDEQVAITAIVIGIYKALRGRETIKGIPDETNRRPAAQTR